MMNGHGNLSVTGKVHAQTMIFALVLIDNGVKAKKVYHLNDGADSDCLDIIGTGHFNAHIRFDYKTRQAIVTIYHRAKDVDIITTRVKSTDALRALFREWVISAF
ncbi:hypothetical protein SB861_26650 [Paraburkholderia sp. SIMBA_049]